MRLRTATKCRNLHGGAKVVTHGVSANHFKEPGTGSFRWRQTYAYGTYVDACDHENVATGTLDVRVHAHYTML